MLFRNSDGFIIEIKKSDFKNDYNYYSTLMRIKMQTMHQSSVQIKTKPRTKVEAFFDNCKESICDSELNLKQPKCNFYSNQAINKLLDEF
uniref:Uncharacterized protein n=1 Tax=viral metagenome TaxID=1070528 RepID=A0A6C0JZL6_9ZZZZ